QVVPCFPGGTLTSVDGDDFEGTVRLKLGPISLTYKGTGKFVERDEAAGRVVMEAQGVDRRGNGTAGITVPGTTRQTDEPTTNDDRRPQRRQYLRQARAVRPRSHPAGLGPDARPVPRLHEGEDGQRRRRVAFDSRCRPASFTR